MKKIILGLFILIALKGFPQKTSQEISTYYLIRHAEKELTEENPELTEEGRARAKRWSEIFKNIAFDAIYSTDYLRTKSTAEPTANSQNLRITLYHPSKIDVNKFLTKTKGKTVLIVGHSNTIPAFVNQLTGKKKYFDIEDDKFGNLYIVEIFKNIKATKLLHID